MAGVILDAGPLYAMLDRRDKYHSWALERLTGLRGPLLTCDAVLTEAFFLLAENARAGRQLGVYLREKLIISHFDSTSNLPQILDLMETYRNIPMSFADACLVRMVEQNPGSAVFTLDRDFSVYRQQRRRVIPLIAPF